MPELPKQYDHAAAQQRWYPFWKERGYFHSEPDPGRTPFTIVIPPPNVTGALHVGHALNNTLQDILIRWRRMQGYNALWVPGTDHAGIATQAVVERRLLEEEKKTRHDLGREKLVARIWAWKDEYEKRILGQLEQMGCSCDWQRTRFTLDPGCTRAVRHTFFKMFKQGLIYRGKRLVNWDPFLQTAVSDDEVFHETVAGHFWHFRYPVIDPLPGEPQYVSIATTRPETMLGDAAVAVHPDPAAALDSAEKELRGRLPEAAEKDRAAIRQQLDDIAERRRTLLPQLIQLRDMARAGRKLMLPLVDRPIPLVADEWAKPELGTGCVKITPAHDPNDYEVGRRRGLPMINILNPDGTLNANAGPYQGLKIQPARKKVVADLEQLGLVEKVEDREIELAHSDRSQTPIEPYLADQWFVKMQDLAQSAMDAVTDGRVKIIPQRFTKGYLDWLGEKRDWPVSRQLWWGHRIPVWTREMKVSELINDDDPDISSLLDVATADAVVTVEALDGMRRWHDIQPDFQDATGWKGLSEAFNKDGDFDVRVYICPQPPIPLSSEQRRKLADLANGAQIPSIDKDGNVLYRSLTADDIPSDAPELGDRVQRYAEEAGFVQDADVLDTWFSSALWPHSTLGWPEQTPELDYYYPTSTLITSRDIITLWVARMVLTGLFNMNDVPFREVFIHPKILDGYGEGMSKSKGNGVDPLDVIEKFGADSLRFGLAYLTTQTQDIRMPVEFECPHCQALIEQTKKNRVLPRVECSKCGKPFSTQWARKPEDVVLPRGAVVSERFELGRNFCNKLWNASRFALMNLEDYTPGVVADSQLAVEDRWILSRLATVTRETTEALETYRYADAGRVLYDFAWNEFCSFYVEMVKARLQDAAGRATAQRVLAYTLDNLLRLLHPMIPFITEEVWQLLGQAAGKRGLAKPEAAADSVMIARWPEADLARQDPQIEARFARFQEALGGLREIRSRHNIPPKTPIRFSVRCDAATAALLQPMAPYFESMAGAQADDWGPAVEPPPTGATFSAAGMDIYVDLAELIDVGAEVARKEKELAELAGRITGKEKQLANKNFVERAKPEVVQKEREALSQLQELHASTLSSLETLRRL